MTLVTLLRHSDGSTPHYGTRELITGKDMCFFFDALHRSSEQFYHLHRVMDGEPVSLEQPAHASLHYSLAGMENTIGETYDGIRCSNILESYRTVHKILECKKKITAPNTARFYVRTQSMKDKRDSNTYVAKGTRLHIQWSIFPIEGPYELEGRIGFTAAGELEDNDKKDLFACLQYALLQDFSVLQIDEQLRKEYNSSLEGGLRSLIARRRKDYIRKPAWDLSLPKWRKLSKKRAQREMPKALMMYAQMQEMFARTQREYAAQEDLAIQLKEEIKEEKTLLTRMGEDMERLPQYTALESQLEEEEEKTELRLFELMKKRVSTLKRLQTLEERKEAYTSFLLDFGKQLEWLKFVALGRHSTKKV